MDLFVWVEGVDVYVAVFGGGVELLGFLAVEETYHSFVVVGSEVLVLVLYLVWGLVVEEKDISFGISCCYNVQVFNVLTANKLGLNSTFKHSNYTLFNIISINTNRS